MDGKINKQMDRWSMGISKNLGAHFLSPKGRNFSISISLSLFFDHLFFLTILKETSPKSEVLSFKSSSTPLEFLGWFETRWKVRSSSPATVECKDFLCSIFTAAVPPHHWQELPAAQLKSPVQPMDVYLDFQQRFKIDFSDTQFSGGLHLCRFIRLGNFPPPSTLPSLFSVHDLLSQ